jgi:hypothetical protein
MKHDFIDDGRCAHGSSQQKSAREEKEEAGVVHRQAFIIVMKAGTGK